MRYFNLDQDVLEPFEIGAMLVSLVGFPDPGEMQAQWEAAEALCAQVLAATRLADPGIGAFWDARFPQYAAIDEREWKRRLVTLKGRIRRRMIAARMARGFLLEGLSGRIARLPTSMARHSLNELSKLVLPESHQSDPEMVERRIWRASRNALPLATALDIYGWARGVDVKSPTFGYPLDDDEAHTTVIALAMIHEEVILEEPRFGVKPDELVRVRQRLLRAA